MALKITQPVLRNWQIVPPTLRTFAICAVGASIYQFLGMLTGRTYEVTPLVLEIVGIASAVTIVIRTWQEAKETRG